MTRLVILALTPLLSIALAGGLRAEPGDDSSTWQGGVEVSKDAAPASPGNTTVIEREGSAAASGVRLTALLTNDGQQIDQGLVWRVFQPSAGDSKAKLIAEKREASPELKLPPGDYTVNAAFGRANLTRKITVKADEATTETFVLNAGGLRVAAFTGGKPAPAGAVTYSIYSDEREQFESRTAVMTGAKPNLIIRLNAGIYRVVSQYGDANARIETDVTVEAGKLTEASVAHVAGRASFKLVAKSGGEAVPDTRWIIQNDTGEIVKESIGALPAHILAPGSYTVVASSAGQLFKNTFEVRDGEKTSVEVVMTDAAAHTGGSVDPPPADTSGQTDIELQPGFDIKSP